MAKIWVSGYFLPRVARKGIENPIPNDMGKVPKTALLAVSRLCFKFSESGFEQNPVPCEKLAKVTFAPYGIGSWSSFCFMISTAFSESKIGGSRMDSLTVVDFRITLPAFPVGGMSSMPVTVRLGLHRPFRYISGKLSWLMGVRVSRATPNPLYSNSP